MFCFVFLLLFLLLLYRNLLFLPYVIIAGSFLVFLFSIFFFSFPPSLRVRGESGIAKERKKERKKDRKLGGFFFFSPLWSSILNTESVSDQQRYQHQERFSVHNTYSTEGRIKRRSTVVDRKGLKKESYHTQLRYIVPTLFSPFSPFSPLPCDPLSPTIRPYSLAFRPRNAF